MHFDRRSFAAVESRLAAHPRRRLAHLPTPLERLDRLSQRLGGPEIWIKRDDCTGLATGGNKTRKLEYLSGEALGDGADVLISFGALQSNHARQTAAAAARLGLECHLILTRRVPHPESAYERSGNRLLDELLGATLHVVADEVAAAQALRGVLDQLATRGRRACVIPVGGSNATGALGYVGCALELARQAEERDVEFGSALLATSSAGTQAGLCVGLHAIGSSTLVRGISVYQPEPALLAAELSRLCNETATRLGVEAPPASRQQVEHGFLGRDYGAPTPEMLEAVRLLARSEGILLDPVYTGKAMAGLLALIQRGELPQDQPVVFVHTGGSAGLFAYPEALRAE